MNNEIKNQYDDLTIYYANELARISNQFTLEEEKTLHIVFSHIKPYEKNPIKFKIEKIDFFSKLELSGDDRYKRYEKIILNLIGKTVTKIENKLEKTKLIGTIITSSKWFQNQSYFEVSLNSEFMPYIEQLKEHYTKIDLNTVCAFKSKHSLSLYKFISSWTDENKQINQRYITTKELKELFSLSKEAYMQNNNFNRASFERRTIKSSLVEINEKTNVIVSFKKKKKGNKVLNYEFTWIQKEKPAISKKTKKQVSIFDLEKESQKQENLISQEQVNCILNNIDKENEVVFDN